ncbi:MAG: alpha/beta hydrolase [Polaromonas sp.]|nr:alpha/beta hydrolase [Polaromonas sp.]
MSTSSAAGKAKRRIPRLPGYLHVSDIQGLAQLATQGMLGAAGLAETVQGNVYKAVAAWFGPLGEKFVDGKLGGSGIRRAGITGLVYGGVRGATRVAGSVADLLLSRAGSRQGEKTSSRRREAMLAVLNGVLGDHLLKTANPLAIRMSFRHEGHTLPLEKAALAQQLPGATGKVLVLMHGLCMNDLQWRTHGASGSLHPVHDHGLQLAAELGYTPVYLHYNSGLHTSENGLQLDALLEQLLHAWPQPVQELALLTHSMGGLVARSACHYAEQAAHGWRGQLKRLVFLGTPHHGAPLERVGNWVDGVLASSIVTRPFAKIGQIRSAGITDLRHGNVLQAEWQSADRFERAPDARQPLPLPAGVACYAVAASTARDDVPRALLKSAVNRKIVGDGLVPVESALGQHAEPRRCLAFSAENQWVAQGMNHLELLSRPEVGAQLVRWLGDIEGTIRVR